MTPVLNLQVLTTNGEYAFPRLSMGSEVELEWDITAGSATVEAGYVSLTGLFKPDLDLAGVGPLFGVGGGRILLRIPRSGKAAIKVTVASGLSVTVCQTILYRA
jgi:hypothetical protein